MTACTLAPLVAVALATTAVFASVTSGAAASPATTAAEPCGPAARRDALSPDDATAIALSAIHPERRTGQPAPVEAVDQTSKSAAACREIYSTTVTPVTADGETCRWVPAALPGPHGVTTPGRALVCEPQGVDVRIY